MGNKTTMTKHSKQLLHPQMKQPSHQHQQRRLPFNYEKIRSSENSATMTSSSTVNVASHFSSSSSNGNYCSRNRSCYNKFVIVCVTMILVLVAMILWIPIHIVGKFTSDDDNNQNYKFGVPSGNNNNNNKNGATATETTTTFPLPPWKEGYLDIHHIHAGVNVATFLIFPDGTTMLIDCGDLDVMKFAQKYSAGSIDIPKLVVVAPYPNDSKTTGQWVIDYIHQFWPHNPPISVVPENDTTTTTTTTEATTARKVIDIMMITHFHQDHIGSIYSDAAATEQQKGKRGDYIRTGIVEVGDEIDFTTIIDRGYPTYDFPFDLEHEWESAPFNNYLNFVRTSLQRGSTVQAEQFQVGNYTQIGFRKKQTDSTKFGHFRVRNIKANLQYSHAKPDNHDIRTIEGQLLYPAPNRKAGMTYDENKVSAAIVIEYGKFKYYEGGDQEYHNMGYPSELPEGTVYELDTVTPTAEVAGPVHVATLNHHGHGVLKVFCDILNPKVLILQGWCSDQPPNHSMETLIQQHDEEKEHSITGGRDVFTTWIDPERHQALGENLSALFKSTLGHVVVRVEPPTSSPLSSSTNNNNNADKQKYYVYVLDGDRQVKEHFGPYDVIRQSKTLYSVGGGRNVIGERSNLESRNCNHDNINTAVNVIQNNVHAQMSTTAAITTRRNWMTKSLIVTGLTGTSAYITTNTVEPSNAVVSPLSQSVDVQSSSGISQQELLLSQRLQTSTLQPPVIGTTTNRKNGDDMTVYPNYLAGTWQVTQTLMNIETPMGLKYVGGPNGNIDIARATMKESSARIGIPISLQLRYIQCCRTAIPQQQQQQQRPNDGVANVVTLEDRLYNTRQRLNQFAGTTTTVVANVEYADTSASNRNGMINTNWYTCNSSSRSSSSSPTIVEASQQDVVPLTTTVTYFRGPVAQKVFVLGHHTSQDRYTTIPNRYGNDSYNNRDSICSGTDESSSSSWTGYEYQRTLFALTNGSTAPPITTDTELIFQFTPVDVDCIKNHEININTDRTTANNDKINHVRGKLRIVGYLNPNDTYYFEVRNRAVTIQDYTLDMIRIVN